MFYVVGVAVLLYGTGGAFIVNQYCTLIIRFIFHFIPMLNAKFTLSLCLFFSRYSGILTGVEGTKLHFVLLLFSYDYMPYVVLDLMITLTILFGKSPCVLFYKNCQY